MARPVTPLLTIAALSALAEGPLHAYVLKKRIDMGLGKMLSVSEGSLYPLLRSLEQAGAIAGHVEPAGHGRPDRVVYAITDAGRDDLARRLAEPLQPGALGQMDFYVRVACFHHLKADERAALVSERRARLERECAALAAACEQVAVLPGHLELADLRARQLHAEIDWLSTLTVSTDRSR